MNETNETDFGSWLNDLEELPVNSTCSLDGPEDCEACGS
jgi:hypothetical protein